MNVNENTLSKLCGPSIINHLIIMVMKFVLKGYELWINSQQKNDNVKINIYDLFNSYLARGYSCTEVLLEQYY